MAEKNYSQRDVVNKLGVQPGHAVVFAIEVKEIEPTLRQRIIAQAGRDPATEDEMADVVLSFVDDTADFTDVLKRWKYRVKPTGAIWLLTPKRDQVGYVNQQVLIEAGQQAGLVDNKVCSISMTTSAMRFVIRKRDRPSL